MFVGSDGGPVFSYDARPASDLQIDTLGEQTLEIVVNEEGLHSVQWEDSMLTELCSEKANSGLSKEDYVGMCGIYNSSGATTYFRPEIKLLWRRVR